MSRILDPKIPTFRNSGIVSFLNFFWAVSSLTVALVIVFLMIEALNSSSLSHSCGNFLIPTLVDIQCWVWNVTTQSSVWHLNSGQNIYLCITILYSKTKYNFIRMESIKKCTSYKRIQYCIQSSCCQWHLWPK